MQSFSKLWFGLKMKNKTM